MGYITLCGAQHDIVGWLRLLEQEKVPHCCTQHVSDQSDVNIFVGISPEEVELDPDNVYIFEPSLASLSEAPSLGIVTEIIDNDSVIRLHTLAEITKTSEPKIGYFHLHEMYHDYEYPVVVESGNCLTLCANLSSQLFLQGVGFKEVPFFSDNYYVEVLTTHIDKEKILQFMRKLLIKAVHMAGLPYIHVWYYPTDSESVFLFRQDVDYVDREGIDNLLSVSAQYNICGTYFINMSGEEEFEDEIGHLTLEEPKTPQELPYLEKIRDSGNEIGNHGYWHYVFDNYDENYTNIRKCTELLEDLLHVTPKGFSAPGGTWHLELAEAIEENNFVYARMQ